MRVHLLLLAAMIGPGFVVSGQENPPATTPSAQNDSTNDPNVRKALDLYNGGKFVDAMPLLEALSAQYPQNAAIKEKLAFSILAYAQSVSDTELRAKARIRARSTALEAQKLGDNSNLLNVVLAIPPDGSQPAYSANKEVDDAMRAGEAEFAKGDLDKAREAYLRAMLLDPNDYEAALFTGDTYFKQHQNSSAGEWFARAIKIDPNRETAYRYWGDALWATGDSAGAREQYIKAIIAEPYNQRALTGLNQWAQRTKTQLHWVKLHDRSQVAEKDPKNINITIDSNLKDDINGTAWTTYALGRASWRGDRFQKEFPGEPKYRHTMREETESLQLMLTVMQGKDFDKNKAKLEPGLLDLKKIDQMGFLEPFVLLNRVDAEIAVDYVPYRAAHRDLIYRYFDEFVVPKASVQ